MKELIDRLISLISAIKSSSLNNFVKVLISVLVGCLIGVMVLLTSCTFKATDLEFCIYNPKSPQCQKA